MFKTTLATLAIAGSLIAGTVLADSHPGGMAEGGVETWHLVAKNHHYDIHYDGKTCFQWGKAEDGSLVPYIVFNPVISIVQEPFDEMDLIQIIECRHYGVHDLKSFK